MYAADGVCARTARTGAAARESLRRDRLVGITTPALHVAAATVLFAYAVVTVTENRTSATPSFASDAPTETPRA